MRWFWWTMGAVVLIAGSGGAWWFKGHSNTSANAKAHTADGRAVPVLIANSAVQDVPLYLYGLGSVTAYNTVTIKTQISGKIDAVLFREGQIVHKGDLLVQIDPRPYEIALAQAEANLVRDSATLRNDRLNLERDIMLRKENLVAQQILDNQQALVNQDEGTVLADQAAIDSAKLNLFYCRIVSPIDGVTGIRQVDIGNYVQPSDSTGIVILTQLEPIAVIFTLPEDDLTPIADQMKQGTLTAAAFTQDGNPILDQMKQGTLMAEAFTRDGKVDLGTGKVLLIDNQINQTTGTIRLKAIFHNPKHALWPNQFVKIRLLVSFRRDTLVVPASAVQHGPEGAFAYVVGADQRVANRHIEVGSIEGDLALIKQGLVTGEQVVTDGQYQLRAGLRVAARNAVDGGQANPTPGPIP